MKKLLVLLCILSVLWIPSAALASKEDIFTVPNEELSLINQCVGYELDPDHVFYIYLFSGSCKDLKVQKLSDAPFSKRVIAAQKDDSSQWILTEENGSYKKGSLVSGSAGIFLHVKEIRELAKELTGAEDAEVWGFQLASYPGNLTAGVAECGNQEIIVPVGSSWKQFYGIDREWYTAEDFIEAVKTIPEPASYAGDPLVHVRIAAGVALVLFVAYLFGRKEFRKVSVQK